MRILIRRPMGWRPVDPREYTNEDELQSLLKASPEIIPLSPPDLPAVAYCREFPVGNYAVDLVGVGSDGGISLIECKLANNREAKRTVVGQILEYGASAWRMDLASFEAAFASRAGISPLDELRERQLDDWDETVCRDRLADNLARGRFRLVIAVDRVSAELRGIIEYVNSQPGDLRLVALELPYFTDGNTEVLVPETYGDELAPAAVAGGPAVEWDEVTFFGAMTERPGDAGVAHDLLDWAGVERLRITWGRGRTYPTVRIALDMPSGSYPLFTLWASGTVELGFGGLKTRPVTDQSAIRIEILKRVNQIPDVDLPADAVDRYPSVRLALLQDADSRGQFIAAWRWAIEQVRSATVATTAGA